MAKIINPLAFNVPIVDPKTGYPTEYFKRILEDIADAKIAASLVEALGGDPGEDQVLTWDDSEDDLAFTPMSEALDQVSDVHGSILYRDSADWQALAPGTSGQFLKTNGPAADPSWATAASGSSAWFLIDQSGVPIAGKTFTVTIASPGVVTCTGHGYADNTPVILTTTGALPTGLSVGTIYFVRNSAADTFELSATSGGASINTSGTQSGVHTVTRTSTWTFSTNVAQVDVTGLASYNELLIIGRSVPASVAGVRQIQVSTNNGSSFYSTSGNYVRVGNDGAGTNQVGFNYSTTTTLNRTLILKLHNLKGAEKFGLIHNQDGITTIFAADPLDVNAIRFNNSGGGNLTGGSLYVYAR